MDEVQRPKLSRTLDLDSPRVVSAQLFEAIRLTDFCLVDLTGTRPNVLFELGVRLAANRLHPVVVEDQTYRQDVYGTADASAEAGWLKNVNGQLEKLRRLLQPVEYAPGAGNVYVIVGVVCWTVSALGTALNCKLNWATPRGGASE